MLARNLERLIAAIAIQMRRADDKKISNVARSAYYRAAIVLICTVVESLVYTLVKKNTTGPDYIINKKKELKNIHTIPKGVLDRDDVVLAKVIVREVSIDDNSVSFYKLNCFLKSRGIVTEREFKKLEYVRKERKRLHLQSLSQPDTGYTKKKAIRVADPVGFLVKKL